MTPLVQPLDDIDFDALVELAREQLPGLAAGSAPGARPEWTDYNYHDPGVTLIELLAWIADTQIYSLGRNRTDERLAFAALLGARPRGTVPARGIIQPADPVERAYRVEAGTPLASAKGSAPRLEAAAAIDVLPLELRSVIREIGAVRTDFTAENKQARAHFAPFGEPPVPGAALRLMLAPADGAALPQGPHLLSLGVEIAGGGRPVHALGGLALSLDTGEPLPIRFDSSRAMQRNGALVVELPDRAPGASYEILLRQTGVAALMPALVRIAPNALPVTQRATFQLEDFRGTGRSGQSLLIDPRALFDTDEAGEGRVWQLVQPRPGVANPGLSVSEADAFQPWHRVDLEAAGPGDRGFALDEQPDGSGIAIRFGNGVNGSRPGIGETISVALQLSAGAAGDVESSTNWVLQAQRTAWVNRVPIGGGIDAPGVDDVVASARTALADGRILATSQQIAAAARALPPAFGVRRASIEEGWEPGRRVPASAATRTLLVSRAGEATETAAWRRAIATSLTPRIALGERLVVASPIYRRFRVTARLIALPGRDPAVLAEAARRDLADRINPIGTRGADWPLGRDVTATMVAGWLRRIDGVAEVTAPALLDERGAPLADGLLPVGRGELPLLLTDQPEDIAAEPGARQ
jgi:hypothetical protein